MASEIQVRMSLLIRKGNLQFQSQPTQFIANMDGDPKGPSPGAITVPITNKLVYFEHLTTPGVCVLRNVDATNYVEYGVFDPQTNVFYPLGEILPGESYILRLSRNFGEQYSGSGTGTTTPENYFCLKANGGSCIVQVEAFEK